MVQHHAPFTTALLLASLVGASLGCGSSIESVSVDAVAASPESYDGELVRVRGWAGLIIRQTLALCVPDTCDCNSSDVQLELWSSPKLSAATSKMIVAPVKGEGNECRFDVAGFDPSAPAYELVGRVHVEPYGSDTQLVLDELDLDESRALYGDGDLDGLKEQPLEPGDHDCSCPLGKFEACGDAGWSLVCSPD